MAEIDLNDAEMSAMLFSGKKKKKSTKAAPAESTEGAAAAAVEGVGSSAPAPVKGSAPPPAVAAAQGDGDPELSYDDMLSRVYNLLNENNLLDEL